MRPRIPTLLASLLLLACLAPAAHAGSAGDDPAPLLKVKPLRSGFDLAPGERTTATVTIVNAMPRDVDVRFTSLDLVAGDVDSFATATVDQTSRSARDWLSFDQEPVTIPAGKTLRTKVSIEVPSDARPGTHAVAFAVSQTFSPLDVNDAESIGSNVRARLNVGSTFVIGVTGDAVSSARIVSTSSPRLLWGDEDATFRARVENDGDTLLDLEAETRLSSFGTFASRELKTPAEQPTLPDGERVLRMEWTDRPWIGWFSPRLVVVGGAGSDVRVEQDLPTVFVLPPWWVLVLLAIAIALPVSSSRRRRRRMQALRESRARRRAGLVDDELDR